MKLARLWPWIEKSATRRFAFAVALALCAALLHWLMFPVTQTRVTFIFFIPAIVLATTLAGRWPGALVAAAGLFNSVLMKSSGALRLPEANEQVALLAAGIVSVLVILVADYYRSLSRREIHDLHELHELSATLASIPELPRQLELIVSTFARMHRATQGLVSIYDAPRDVLTVAASVGLSPRTLEEIGERRGGEGVCGLVCVDKVRVVIEDTERDDRVADARALLRREGVRAVHSTPLIARNGAVLGALTVHLPDPFRVTDREIRIADICARKAAVFIERARAEELVSQRDRRFEAVLEVSGVPFLIWSPVRDSSGAVVDMRFVFVNTAAARVMRVEAVEYVGKCVREVLPHAWDEPGRLAMYVEALETGKVVEMERQTAADGNHAWYHIVASPLEGNVAVWFADITQRKRHERELLEADRRKDEFLATLAHELRNPLAPIRQAAAIARNPNATDAQRRWSHNVIERQVQHMALLLEDLLDVSRITHGTLQLRKQQTDLQSIVGAAVETARPLIDERRHQLDIDVPDALQVVGDPLRLAQVLSNLLTNAAKYTPPGGSLRVQGMQAGDELVITVTDNGIGIDRDDLPRVFGMFTQLRSASDPVGGGLGIGLALTKGIVELHGGRIEAASGGAGQGSRFTVRLPNPSALSSPVAGLPETRGASSAPGRKILLADDNRDAAESLAVLLRLEGHEVHLAHDGEAALRVYERERPDVALLDIGMPRGNGYDVARRIRALGGDGVLLLAITGWGQDADKMQSRAAGFDHHLTKPVEPESLLVLLGREPQAR